jgi:hypothetical protein
MASHCLGVSTAVSLVLLFKHAVMEVHQLGLKILHWEALHALTTLLRATHCVLLSNLLGKMPVLKLRTQPTTMRPTFDGSDNGPSDPPNFYQLGEHHIHLDLSYSKVDGSAALFEILTLSSLLTMPATSSNSTTFPSNLRSKSLKLANATSWLGLLSN